MEPPFVDCQSCGDRVPHVDWQKHQRKHLLGDLPILTPGEVMYRHEREVMRWRIAHNGTDAMATPSSPRSTMRTLLELRARPWFVRALLGLGLAGAAYAIARHVLP